MMIRAFAVPILCLLTASPALAGGVAQALPTAEGAGLVLGGADLGFGQNRHPIYQSPEGLSFGSLSGPRGGTGLAMGGYVAYAVDDYMLSSSLHNTAVGSMADLAAAYTGSLLGYQGIAAVKVGYGWMRSAVYTPESTGLSPQGVEPYHSSMAVALSWSQPIAPALSLTGFAAATRSTAPDETTMAGVHLGAEFGLRF